MKDIVEIKNANIDYGGKAYGLAKLAKKDIPVPNGFALSNKIIYKAIKNDKDTIDNISVFLNNLEDKLAVRSSAANEDGKKKSFAGIFETILNVDNDLNNVLDAIKVVAESANKKNVSNYNKGNNLMNIIVQNMVSPSISGVAFTQAIDYFGKTVLLIEYVKGTADKLVSGNVTPERIILKYSENGNIIPSNNKLINILIPSLQKIIKEFNIPTDIEWCIDKNKKPFFIQARPITQKVLINSFTEKANFWFKEFRSPLFYSTDPNNKIYYTDVILFFKNNITHAYNLNNKEKKCALRGYKNFTNPVWIKKYEEQIENIKKEINITKENYQNISDLSNKEFATSFFKFLNLLCKVGNIYNKTEPYMLEIIEKNELKYHTLIEKISELRWELRKEVESTYHFLYSTLLRELSKRYKVNLFDLNYYTFEELKNLFNNIKVDGVIIKERKNGFALIC
ncbi:MAG: PEP/pyruvate-binding domain-containing protein, partial [Bacilli bacterium]|nr:PEP/pyruvate-binding domain-containing protein [Bacilli bacterium]